MDTEGIRTLQQGPFGIDQDRGWHTSAATTPSDRPLRQFGMGLVGYCWEEGGPSRAAREGRESLEQHVRKLASLPFVDVLYIRCDWRDVQSRPGRLDLHPVWDLALRAAREHGLRIAFRVQMSSPNIQPGQRSLPDFLQSTVPYVNIGPSVTRQGRDAFDLYEPRYDHPAFLRAFRELNELLVERFNGDPIVEFADLMMYGFWGEGHTHSNPHSFPDSLAAERTCLQLARIQLELWDRTHLVVNAQPDISGVGNEAVQELCRSRGCWIRSDSVLVEEPIQVQRLANRAPDAAAVLEDGYFRLYRPEGDYLPVERGGRNRLETTMLHVLDMKGNYWSLWTEADNILRYHQRYPHGLDTLRSHIGYRLRPAWVWQRKRGGATELVTAVVNDGAAGVPGRLVLHASTPTGRPLASGCLDPGLPRGGDLRQAALPLPSELEETTVCLGATLLTRFGAEHPLEWACHEPLEPDGSLRVALLGKEDARWRKGV